MIQHVYLVVYEPDHEGETVLSLHASAEGAAAEARKVAPELGFHGEEIAGTYGPSWDSGGATLGVERMDLLP